MRALPIPSLALLPLLPLLPVLALLGGCGGARPAPAPLAPAPGYVLTTSPELAPLESRLRARIARDTGEVAVALIDLASGRRLGVNQDVRMHAASTMKVPIMMELFRQADRGRLAVDDSVPVVNVFRSLADGTPYTLRTDVDTALVARIGQRWPRRRIAHGMITVSSNLGANVLLAELTADSVRHLMASIGAQDHEVLRGLSDDAAFARGMNNTTTAAALARAMEAVARCERHTRASCDAMLAMLEAQRYRSDIPAGLPPGTRVGNKTGSITAHRHDAAIVMPAGRRPYVLVVLTRRLATGAARTLMSDLSRTVWEELAAR